MDEETLLEIVKEYGVERPLFIIDHNKIRENYQRFNKNLPRVQAYYAIKANSEPAIIETLFKEGASFDVASIAEFLLVYDLIETWTKPESDFYIWDKIIFSNTIKPATTLKALKKYKPLVTYDNIDELHKIKKFCDTAGLILRLKVPDTGSMVEMGGKFGASPAEAVDLIKAAIDNGLNVEGLSFHVGSQCTNFRNYVDALVICSSIFKEIERYGLKIGRLDNGNKILDMGGGFPTSYTDEVPAFETLAEIINSELDRLFKGDYEIIAEPGRFIIGDAALNISRIQGRSRRDSKRFYYINDGVYHTFSGVVFDHCVYHFRTFSKDKDKGNIEVCTVAGPTCDSFDKISTSEQLPGELEIGDLLIADKVGAYTTASSTNFNGIPGAIIININT
ncbi:MAG: type III PLP-dependent enzyme [Candidatus Latescibacteria bacterium]|nr:type III PLP-dependent enzyme [Candidatus Latescibacterota bacterium]